MANKYRKENSNSSITCSICIVTCGLSNRSIDCRLEYSSFIMPELPPFPLPPSIGHCCEITECGGGESSMQWHWLSWHCADVPANDWCIVREQREEKVWRMHSILYTSTTNCATDLGGHMQDTMTMIVRSRIRSRSRSDREDAYNFHFYLDMMDYCSDYSDMGCSMMVRAVHFVALCWLALLCIGYYGVVIDHDPLLLRSNSPTPFKCSLSHSFVRFDEWVAVVWDSRNFAYRFNINSLNFDFCCFYSCILFN